MSESDWLDELFENRNFHHRELDACFYDAVAVHSAKEAIRQHIEREKREARIDELEQLFGDYSRDGISRSYTVYNEWVRNRLAELRKDTDNGR